MPRSTTPSAGGGSPVATKRHKPDRLIIVDASLSRRVAATLRERGREAKALTELGLRAALDPQVLEDVFSQYPEAVLLTGDDRMPEAHPEPIRRFRATMATVEPWDRRPRATRVGDLPQEEMWKREVSQRWAHEVAQQERATIWRYSERRRRWTPNIRNPQGKLFKA